MSMTAAMCTRLRKHVQRGVEQIERAMRDGVISPREQAEIYAHQTETLSLSEEHETTTKLAGALLHGGFTRRAYYAAAEYDGLYGTGELTEHVKRPA